MESVPGSQAAAPIPMTPLDAISRAVLGASAPIREPTTKTDTPPSITFLRPIRSPRLPKASIKAANIRA